MSIADARVGVIIPALNEEEALPKVLREIPCGVDTILVVDNGSTDQTAAAAQAAGASVVFERRRGYGSACLRGIAELGRCDIVVFLDADHSDHPEYLPQLVMPIVAGEADMVLGSRLLGKREPGAMPPQAVWGNRLACFLMRVLLGANYTDLGPFRAIRCSALARLGMTDTNFGWTVEMQIKAKHAGLRCREIPVPYRKRVGISKISGTVGGTIKAGYKILYTIVRYAF